MSLRTIAILLGMALFASWAVQFGSWTWLITMPLAGYAGWVSAELDRREGRWS